MTKYIIDEKMFPEFNADPVITPWAATSTKALNLVTDPISMKARWEVIDKKNRITAFMGRSFSIAAHVFNHLP